MPSNAEAPTAARRHSKALACAHCRRRKIRCDRNIPCSNCLMINAKCTPCTPAPARRRRKASKGLLERLDRCEALLENFVTHASPSALEMGPRQLSQPSVTQYQPISNSVMPIALEPFKEPSMENITQTKDNTCLFNSSLSYDNALKAIRHVTDSEDIEGSRALDHEISSHEDNTLFLLPNISTPYSIGSCQPDPVHIFRLWQIYLERVNPLTKIIHVPTLQPYVTEATTNPDNIPQNYQCLLCAVSLMATVSLDEPECRELLGMPRGNLLQELVARTRHALLQFDLFSNDDMAVLQALVLFLISLQDHCDKQTAWIFSGTVLRIATNMGYHRDGELLNLIPFEIEMRRRIWWQILLQEASLTGMGQKAFQRTFDTKQPQNFNDVDLFPGSTRPIKSRDGPTEMGFVLIINRVIEFVMDSGRAGAENDKILTIERFLDLDQGLQEMERRYINASVGGAHVLALAFRSIVSANLLNIFDSSKERLEQGDIMFAPEYTFSEVTFADNDRSGDVYACMAKYGFTWFARQHFQHHVLVGLVSHLHRRPTELVSDRG
ncbi:fungal-specific transcription factor domain-containing protein [Fusarium oxysporum f. sp. albedinis]|nr:fungal-specific transcription factor domain-containing protein [Fusarium oxysporum f. sp. albedinis]KAJ0130209.1 Uncharacterized protein HZ326_26687 [Fusarium oxysporum f. sp. albedinis]KAK2471225.1 hypothetical protein H9L39_17456 [Fusarium oxysporum f. sp. albedinis]